MDIKFKNESKIKVINDNNVVRGKRREIISKRCFDDTNCLYPNLKCVDCSIYKSL